MPRTKKSTGGTITGTPMRWSRRAVARATDPGRRGRKIRVQKTAVAVRSVSDSDFSHSRTPISSVGAPAERRVPGRLSPNAWGGGADDEEAHVGTKFGRSVTHFIDFYVASHTEGHRLGNRFRIAEVRLVYDLLLAWDAPCDVPSGCASETPVSQGQ